MESSSLVAIPGSRLPEMLGNFHLDNHHVEEWSDPSEPGSKHHGRKEVGKWVNLERQADIHYQKQEDSKQSERGQERSRTEVIQGSAPDSSFQVVRSHRQFQDGDETSGSTMQQSTSSYHVSSSRGVRSTTKTTSNKSTTKTVTVSGGGRADDFENLRMSFTPLDTSTQRERINVSRSGTMGIRRPPTRRHTPAALICSSPEDGPDIHRPEDGQILVDSDDNLRDTPDPDVGKGGEQTGISIVGFKNISPKIRVGFPVEIQLELQTKLRSSSTTLEREHHHHNQVDTPELDYRNDRKETDSSKIHKIPVESSSLAQELSSVTSRSSNFETQERRKSFLSENFENEKSFKDIAQRRSSVHLFSSNREELSRANHTNNSKNQRHSAISLLTDGSSQERSVLPWSLIQNIQQIRRSKEEENSKIYSSGASSSGDDYIENHKFIEDEGDLRGSKSILARFDDSSIQRDSFAQRLRAISSVNNSSNKGGKKTVVTLNASEESLLYEGKSSLEGNDDSLEVEDDSQERNKESFESTTDFQYQANPFIHQDSCLISTPDVLHHDNNSSSNSLSPSLERSRKLLKMLDETPDLLNKMSFKNYFSSSATSETKQERKDWDVEVEEVEKDDMDWETQRQLSFLNDSLSRIIDESRNNSLDCAINDKTTGRIVELLEGSKLTTASDSTTTTSSIRRHVEAVSQEPEMDLNGNFKEIVKMNLVSQTWISAADHKPSQTVVDNDVVTSISATNDAYKNTSKGPKRVEFCKTEVHFTPDSGKFNIVETDENKPSTAHLFRRKKRSERKAAAAAAAATAISLEQSTVVATSSSSSMSSLDSNSEKQDKAYVLEMKVDSEGGAGSRQKRVSNSEVSIIYSSNQNAEGKTALPLLTSKSDSEKSDESGGERNLRDKRVLISLEKTLEKLSDTVAAKREEFRDENDDIRSPSHTILSNYGEMKIQRYLKQLKSNSNSRENSSSPTGSPTPPEDRDDEHFPFDNILYENGSFVPLATRRSLIEMNNRNRKRMTAANSHSSDNSSTTSTYSLPTSDKDQYGTLRLGSVEATVTTGGSQPQITSVEFRYTKDRSEDKEDEDVEYHNLSVKERRERFSSVPSPVMPHYAGRESSSKSYSRQSAVMSPIESDQSSSPQSPSSALYLSKKPPTPILPMQFANFTKAGAELRERFYAKSTSTNNTSNTCVCTTSTETEMNSSNSRSLLSSSGKRGDTKPHELKAKSVVTIGPSDEYSGSNEELNDIKSSHEIVVMAATLRTNENDIECDRASPEPEPVLSMDHTWKGPAHFDSQQASLSRKQAGSKFLTFPKSPRMLEPEWVSKAKSRETRVTDWSLIEKQQQTSTNARNTEPPWISEIRFRNKPPSGNHEEVKSLPKISVVYPWQRESSSKESSMERDDTDHLEESHIVSIVPEPTSHQKKDKQFGSYDLYSGKSLPPIKSLKSVAEVSVPSRKSRSIVEVHSEPEHYIHSSPKQYQHRHQGRKEYVETRKSGSVLTKSDRKSASMRIISETGSISPPDYENVKEPETFPKKSRKPLQLSQTNKDVSSREVSKGEEKYKTQNQPKPPKPPQRVTSLSKQDHQPMNNRDTTLMTIPPFRDQSRSYHKEKSAGSGSNITSNSHSITTSSKRSASRRNKSDLEESIAGTGDSIQVHHRHPTIQITKLPMRTAKVSVVDGKRVSSSGGGTGSSSKSKPKHHASSPSQGEKGKSKQATTTPPTSATPGASTPTKRDPKGKSGKAPDTSNSTRKARTSAPKTGQSVPLKTTTRPPSSEMETKKRKTTSPTSSRELNGRK